MVPIAQWLVHRVVVPATRVRFPLGTPVKTLDVFRGFLLIIFVKNFLLLRLSVT